MIGREGTLMNESISSTQVDDPMVPVASVTRWPLPAAGSVRLEVTRSGGHTGFVAPTSAPGRFWAAERALAFLESLSPTASATP